MSENPMPAPQQQQQLHIRLSAVEVQMAALERKLEDWIDENQNLAKSVNRFESSIVLLSESVKQIKDFELELRSLRDKLLTYEVKFESINELKKLVWATMLAVIPGSIGVVLEIVKFIAVKPH